MGKNTKTWISLEQNITFLWNKKIINMHLRWLFLGSYCFLVEVILQKKQFFSEILQLQCWNKPDHKHTKLFFSPGILTKRVICGYFVSIFVYFFYVPPYFLGNHSVFSHEILKFTSLTVIRLRKLRACSYFVGQFGTCFYPFESMLPY